VSTERETRGRKPIARTSAHKRLNGRITAEFHHILKETAEKEGISMTQLIIKAVHFYKIDKDTKSKND